MDFLADATWQNYDPEGQVFQRLQQIKKLIPVGVESILDVGCGNGIITNELAREFTVTGVDPSAAALSYVQCTKIEASIEDIPLADSSFDLVCCNEVLEHLDNETLYKGIRELKRLTRNYLLISVPYREQLSNKLFCCASCGHKEHVHGHLQSYDIIRLDSLFLPEFTRQEQSIFGMLERDTIPILRELKHMLGQWFEPPPGSKCPACGSTEFLLKRNLLTKIINALNKVITRPRPYWLLILYARK